MAHPLDFLRRPLPPAIRDRALQLEDMGVDERVLDGCRTVPVNVLYGLPDYPVIVQEFSWEIQDDPRTLARTWKFLDHWRREIEGPIVKLRLGIRRPVVPFLRVVKAEFSL